MNLLSLPRPNRLTLAWMLVGLAVVGCSTPRQRAPVEDRMTSPPRPAAAAPSPSAASPAQVSGAAGAPSVESRQTAMADNAGKAGFYTVRPGDTLIRIGLDQGQNWRDIARWSGLDNPNLIEVGQVLRVVPPGTDPTVAASRPVGSGRAEARPLETRPATPSAVPSGAASAASTNPPVANTAPARDAEEEVSWQWPAPGPVLSPFEEGGSKGLAIGGKTGEPVMAAADGRVVYAGSGLRGYGNLVIVKHNATFLTAYAHNQALLVKEDQVVRRGQKIAEMGSSDAERVQLHFEIRRLGKPVDPARLLPAR